MDKLTRRVRKTIERYDLIQPGDRVVVGVSGGADSVCLLHVLLELSADFGFDIHVAHLNHQIRGEAADEDAIFVRDLAKRWKVPFTIESCDVPALAAKHKMALEEAARRARYAFLGRVATEHNAQSIAVGHNADDQVETILMHWLRGSGLAGLRGMLPSTPLAGLRLFAEDNQRFVSSAIRIIRPLLEVRRADIEAYCDYLNIKPRFDLSNLDTTYFRNRLRHELIPYLETYQPNIREILRRTGQIVMADYALLRDLMERAWTETVRSESAEAITFDLQQWRALPLSTKRSIVREAIHRLRRSLRNINWIHVENAVEALESKPAGTQVTLPQGLMMTIEYDQFRIADRGYMPTTSDIPLLSISPIPLTVPGTTHLPDSVWSVQANLLEIAEYRSEYEPNPDRWQAFFDYDTVKEPLSLRTRQPGDQFQPLNMRGHHQTVRDFMINAKIPQAFRDRIPLLVSPQGILWIVGWRPSETAKITDRTKRVLYIAFRRGARRVED